MKYFAESKKILDLECGDGRNAIFGAKMGYEVYAVDFSTEALNRLKYFAISERLEIVTKLMDITSKEEVSTLEIKVDAVIVNHYRMAREIYPFIKPVTSSSEFVVKYSCKVLFSSCKWHIL